MSDNKAAFTQRVISAVLGVLALLALCIAGGVTGMQIAVVFSMLMATREFTRLAFRHPSLPWNLRVLFVAACLGLFALLYFHGEWTGEAIAMLIAAYLSSSLWCARGKVDNSTLLTTLTLGLFGVIYCALFPAYAMRLVALPDGGRWFLFLLAVVLCGDTFAYFGGRWLGERKMMPEVSPNKTWVGAASGLVGSALAGIVVFPDAGPAVTLLFCMACGSVAQSGDLLMSLVKRVAHVKDSGGLMPGHGGMLDRLDGVFIACPFVYAFAAYIRGG